MTQPAHGPNSEFLATSPATPDRARATALLDARRPALATIPEAELMRPRVSWEVALELTGNLTRLFRAYVTGPGDLSDSAWQNVQSALSEVEPAAICYFAAQNTIETAEPANLVARKRELQRQVREHDAFLTRWGRPAFEDHTKEAPSVAAILSGTGTADDAEDTVAWVAMWLRHPDVMAKSPVTPQYLEQAEADATELLPLLAADETESASRDLARRTFTAWSRLFNRLTKVGRFLGPDDVSWPGIAAPRTRTPPKDGAADSDGGATPANPTVPPTA